jgi:hypothetical protein
LIDVFAGRVHERQPSAGVTAFRKLLKREDLREQSYETEDLYSVPIGSRFHPERAPIWETDPSVGTTEKWTRLESPVEAVG